MQWRSSAFCMKKLLLFCWSFRPWSCWGESWRPLFFFLFFITLCLAFHWLPPYASRHLHANQLIYLRQMSRKQHLPLFTFRFSLFTFHCSLLLVCFYALAWLLFYLSFACCLLLISRSFQCIVWGRWAENSVCHFSLFDFHFFSGLFLHFGLTSILSFICMLSFAHQPIIPVHRLR